MTTQPPPSQPVASAPTLADRIRFVMDDLSDLQREVEGLGHFLGADHAVNGLRQARTYASDCLWRLGRLAAKQSDDPAHTDGPKPYLCGCPSDDPRPCPLHDRDSDDPAQAGER